MRISTSIRTTATRKRPSIWTPPSIAIETCCGMIGHEARGLCFISYLAYWLSPSLQRWALSFCNPFQGPVHGLKDHESLSSRAVGMNGRPACFQSRFVPTRIIAHERIRLCSPFLGPLPLRLFPAAALLDPPESAAHLKTSKPTRRSAITSVQDRSRQSVLLECIRQHARSCAAPP